MATISKKRYQAEAPFGGNPYGNYSILSFNMRTKSNGSVIDSDTATGPAIGDKIVLGLLPADAILFDSVAIVSDAFSAGMTGNLGFEYEDGVDSATVPQSANYFGTVNLATVGRTRNTTGNAPVRLPKDARLILTTAGAASAEAGVLHVNVMAEQTGG